MLAMFIEVARADGNVNTAEYESLMELLARFAPSAVGFSELEQWVSAGPPRVEVRLPEAAVKLFLKEAVAIARADGKIAEVEISTIKALIERHFDLDQVA